MAEMQAVGAARPPAWADASSSVVTCPSKAFSPSSSRRARATALSCQAQRASDARRAREPVRDHPGAKAGPGDRRWEGRSGWAWGSEVRAHRQCRAKSSQEGQDGAGGGGATHTYPRLPETLLVSPPAPDPLCTHRLRLCGDFLATGPGEQENGPPPGGLPPASWSPSMFPTDPPQDLLMVETPGPGLPAPPLLHDHTESQP